MTLINWALSVVIWPKSFRQSDNYLYKMSTFIGCLPSNVCQKQPVVSETIVGFTMSLFLTLDYWLKDSAEVLLHFTFPSLWAGWCQSLQSKLVTWAILIKTGLFLRSSVEYYVPCKTANESHSDEIGHTLASVSTFLRVNLKKEKKTASPN